MARGLRPRPSARRRLTLPPSKAQRSSASARTKATRTAARPQARRLRARAGFRRARCRRPERPPVRLPVLVTCFRVTRLLHPVRALCPHMRSRRQHQSGRGPCLPASRRSSSRPRLPAHYRGGNANGCPALGLMRLFSWRCTDWSDVGAALADFACSAASRTPWGLCPLPTPTQRHAGKCVAPGAPSARELSFRSGSPPLGQRCVIMVFRLQSLVSSSELRSRAIDLKACCFCTSS